MATVTRFTLLLLSLTGLSFAEIPPQNFLWGENGPPVPTSVKASNSFRTARSAGLGARDTVCTNSATSRNCWASGYSVATDFDAKWPSTGKVVPVCKSSYQSNKFF